MEDNVTHLSLHSPEATRWMDTAELRANFHSDSLMKRPGLDLIYWEQDRTVAGSAMPVDSDVVLGGWSKIRADYFCQRREIGSE